MKVQDDKFTDIISTDEWQIETDDGWQDISAVCKTVEYDEWVLKLEDDYELICADDHIVFCEGYEEKLVKDLTGDDYVLTDKGIKRVLSVIKTDNSSQMYDVQVDTDRHSYYTNGILSHNTTVTGIYALWKALYTKKKMNIYILSNKGESAKDFLLRIKDVYCDLDPYLKRGIIEWNKTSIVFENGTAIHTSTTTPDSIRGRSVSLLILDEFAHVRPEVADPFWTSAQPTVASGSAQIIIISTPNGNTGQYYNIYDGAEKGINGFTPYRVEWDEIPGRDEAFKMKTISETSLKVWNQEYACVGSDTFINIKDKFTSEIYSVRIGELYSRSLMKNALYKIETPFGYVPFDGIRRLPDKQRLHRVTIDNGTYCDVTYNHVFVVNGESKTYALLQEGDKLETKDGLKTIINLEDLNKEEYVYDVLEVKNENHSFYSNDIVSHNCSFLGSSSTLINGEVLKQLEDGICDPIKKFTNFEVWETPKEGRMYILGCDVAMGVGRDYSVIQVIDITNPKRFRQVAVFADDYVRTPEFTSKINEIGKLYNYAFAIVENNTFGAQICRDLWNDYEYEWLYYEKGKNEKGINANKKTKVISNAALKRYVEQGMMVVQDKKTLKEMQGYIELSEDKYGCEDGESSRDDRVDALRWVCYFAVSDYWRDLEEFYRQQHGIQLSDYDMTEYNVGSGDSFEPIIFNNDNVQQMEIDEDGLVWS